MSYEWLKSESGPKILVEAVKLLGTKESVGNANNPLILGWAKELGLQKVYTNDAIPWCGLFIAYVAKMAGKDVVKNPLYALNWATWGNPIDKPELGDILTFKRDGGGHVGIYVGEDNDFYHVLGGNQGDAVTVSRIAKTRLYRARRTQWSIAQPKNVRRVFLEAKGEITTNEK
jgi:uncharacterized protein (TIGR02594 family)